MKPEFETEPEPLPPAWIFVPGLLVAIVLLYPNFLQPNDAFLLRFQIAGLGLAALCVGGIVASSFRWKAARVLAVTVLALYWVAVGALCFFTLLSPGFMLVYVGFLTIPAFLIVGLCTAYTRRGLKLAWWRGALIAGFSCGFVISALLSALALKRHR